MKIKSQNANRLENEEELQFSTLILYDSDVIAVGYILNAEHSM